MNTITLIGYLGADPNYVKFTETNGEPEHDVHEASFTLSTKRFHSNKLVTDWHNIVVKNPNLIKSVLIPYLFKGSQVAVTGELVYDSHEKNGVQIKIAKIIVREHRNFELIKKPATGEKEINSTHDSNNMEASSSDLNP